MTLTRQEQKCSREAFFELASGYPQVELPVYLAEAVRRPSHGLVGCRFPPCGRMVANFDLWEIAMEFELSLTLRENGNELMPPAKWAGEMESNPSAQTLGLSLAQ